jgi:hypothetical protein
MSGNLLRSCAGCSAHLLTNDGATQSLFCAKCKPKHVTPFEKWAANVSAGDTVYVQPYAAWRGLSHSQYLVVGRDGNTLTVQVLGITESRMKVHIADCGEHDLTPRRRTGALD